MEYKGYTVTERNHEVIIEKVTDFNPVTIFECGQSFRWMRQKDGSYTGIVRERVVNIKYTDGRLEISNTNMADFKDIWFDYLDLGRDYAKIKKKIMKDEVMEEAIRFGNGMRILRQDLWETLISFIISANNNISRIIKIVGIIAEEFGDEIGYNGEIYYSFPDKARLSASSLEKLEICKGGFRCKYIYQTSQMLEGGVVDLEQIPGMDTDTARDMLMKFPGVGPKVADCVLLYSGTRYDVFPTDVWVKRVMEELYFKREASFKEIHAFSKEYFGDLAGFAQQYLFYYARENKIGVGK